MSRRDKHIKTESRLVVAKGLGKWMGMGIFLAAEVGQWNALKHYEHIESHWKGSGEREW